MRRPNQRHAVLTFTVLAGTAALMGAGFPAQTFVAKGVPPDEYAESVCGSTGDWFDEIVDLSGELADGLSDASDTDEQQDVAIDFLDAAIDATDTWLEEIEDAGRPDVDDGKAIAKGYRKGARDTRKVLVNAAKEAEDLPTDDDEEFAERLDKLGTSIDEGLDEAGLAVTDTEEDASREYREALEDATACEELREAVGDAT